MTHFRRLVREVHRRSLWQELSIYLVGSWVALQVVDGLTDTAGLPDWVPSFALVLLVIGLPICLATAFVQEGVGGEEAGTAPGPAEEEPLPGSVVAAGAGTAAEGRATVPAEDGRLHHRLFTWRNALVGGVLAFALLGAAVAVYYVMWSSGIGPVGSLVAQGVIDERDRVVLADFENATPDAALGGVVTEALRVDLLESRILTVVDPGYAAQVLRRMERDPEARLTPEVAREVAVREGIKAVIRGEVGSAGEGYVLTAHLVSAEDGRTLAAFRETAEDDGVLVAAIDRLSQKIREKAGESLRTIRAGEPLETVTTSSLEALRKYAEADRAINEGDDRRGIRLLEEALVEDSTFAMAWRRLGVVLGNENLDREREIEALTRAHRLRDRLTAREAGLASAMYFWSVERDEARVADAYERVLAERPGDPRALNNLALLYNQRNEYERAEELLRRAVGGSGESNTAHQNLVHILARQAKWDEARRALARGLERYPGYSELHELSAELTVEAGELERADSILAEIHRRFRDDLPARWSATVLQAVVDEARGRLRDVRGHVNQLTEIAEDADRPNWALDARIDEALLYDFFLLDDRNAALARAEAALARYPLAEMQPLERPEEDLALFFAVLGEEDRAREYMALRDRSNPPEYRGPFWDVLPRSVEAQLGMARGEGLDTLASVFAAIREDLPCEHCYSMEEAMAHERAGDLEAAAEAYEGVLAETRSWESWPGLFVNHARALERLGRIHEELGRPERAAPYYDELAAMWADADPELQPLVQRARGRALALRNGEAPAGS